MRVETKIARHVFALFLGFFALALGSAVEAAPKNGRVVQGSGSIERSGTHTDIHQQSDFLATRWDSFNIATHESVQAHQPSSTARLLIRVDGGATNIAGTFTANGITILENQNGVQFSRGAIVNVGGLLATSSRISGVNGNHWQLNGTGGAVINHGQIVAGAGGAILAAVKVQNTGDITSKGGDVALGAGSSFTVDFAGSMVGFEITQAASGASIVNTGKIESQGGVVALSAQEAQAVRTNVVSVGGVVKATKMERRGGVVYLSGGDEGIAEVSGDVQASDKVQTTGEYVVVKEDAVVKAPEILVGGDFQGKGDVPTSRRTLVERGALLDAGAGGRVIVWSDDVTWFNGDISAPEGFAEVSGKEVLASVNLAGIDVGELLLDPADIIIAAAGTGDAVTASIAAADPGTTVTLNVATINSFAGALSLAASNTIMVDGEILKPTGNLTLIAGGVLTINANITTSAGDLALTGTGGIALTAATTTLTGGAISLTGVINETGSDARNLTINASGILTLNSNITLPTGGITGRLEITAFRVNLPSAIALAPSRLLIVFNDPAAVNFETSFDGAGVAGSTFPGIESDLIRTIFTYAPRDCGGEAVCELTSMDNVDEIGQGFRLSPTLTARTSITITGRGFVLTFGGTGPISITAPTVSIESRAINIGGRNFTITANGGTLTLGASITTTGNITLSSTGANAGITLMFNTGLEGRDISITGAIGGSGGSSFTAIASGVLTLNDNINTGTNGLVLTGTGGITLANAAGLTLRGGAVTLTGVVTADNTPLTIEAQDGIVINNNIDIGAGRLELIAGLGDGGTAFINVHDARPDPDDDTVRLTITAGSFLWAQDAQFGTGDTPPATFVLPMGVVIEGIYFGTEDSADNPDWLNVRQFQAVRYVLGDGTGDIVVPLETINAVESITLDAGADGTITFSGMGAITLAAPLITITAMAITLGDRALTITASGVLTLNFTAATTITGTGTAELSVIAENITFSGTAPRLNVPTVSLELTDEDSSFGATAPFAANSMIGTLNITTNEPAATTPLEYRDWMAAMGRNLTIASPGIIIGSTAINLGTGDLTLGGEFGVLLTNPAGLTITARDVTFPGLNLISREGVDVLAFVVVASGDIALNSNISLPAARVELRADADGDRMGMITASTFPALLASSLFLQQAGAFAANLFLASSSSRVSGAVELRITAAGVDQTIHEWMTNFRSTDFSLRGEGDVVLTSITLPAAADFGTGAVDLQAAAIALTAATTTLTGGAISLTGAISETADTRNLTITASGVLTLNSSIVLDSPTQGGLMITASLINIPGTETIGLRATPLRIEFTDPSATTEALGYMGDSERRVTVSDALVYVFAPRGCAGADICMLASPSNAALHLNPTLTAGTSITLNAGANALTFSGTGAITITSPIIMITAGSIDIGNRTLTITASGGAITLSMLTSITGTGAASVSLTAATIAGLSSSLTVDVPSISIARDVAFGTSPPVAFGAALTSLTLTTAGDQLVFNWMIIEGRSLSVTAGGRLTVNVRGGFTLGNSADLTLNGMGSIVFSSNPPPPTIGLTARDITLSSEGNITFNRDLILTASQDITLNGTIDGSANNRNFSAIATRNLTFLNTTINTGTAALTLSSSGGILLDGDAVALSGGAVTITGVINETASGSSPSHHHRFGCADAEYEDHHRNRQPHFERRVHLFGRRRRHFERRRGEHHRRD